MTKVFYHEWHEFTNVAWLMKRWMAGTMKRLYSEKHEIR